jgi:hypothetical protein
MAANPTKRNNFLVGLALLLMTSGAAQARPGLILGDWRMNADLDSGMPGDAGFTINAETAWNYSGRGRSNCSKFE